MCKPTNLGTLILTLFAMGCGSGSNGDTQTGPSGDAGAGAKSSNDSSAPVETKDPRPPVRPADSPPLGLTWSAAESGTSNGLSVVIWADDRFIAVGDGGTVLKSSDGATWSALSSGITDNLRSLTWTGKLLVAVAADGKVLTSEDGTSWTERGANLKKLMRQVAWTGQVFSALGLEGNTAISSDGITWTPRQIMDLHSFVPTSAAWTGSVLIWGGYNSLTEVTFNEGMAFSTKDGVTFTTMSPGYQCNSIFGIAWNDADSIPGLTTEYNGKLIGAGRNGEMFTMSYGRWDSGKWGEGYVSTTDLYAVIWTGVEAVAVGEGGLVLQSTTGHYRSWTEASVPKGANFTSLAWNQDRLVAVGSAGTIITSP